ncbi:MAG: HAD-IA family hydrolase [Anaerolineales bacterium]|nr:HAD-IA family hydrolase [Anaerolineales bacterium]
MIKAVLLDLDETLIHNPANRFVEAYIKHLIDFMVHHRPDLAVPQLTKAILNATRQTITNCEPTTTNRDVFYGYFTAAMGLPADDMTPLMQEFMETAYPDLRPLTAPIPIAVELVEWLLQHQVAVAVATNPLFHRSAIEQRIQWAGLDPTKFWFVTTLDNVHYTKPHSQYYEEILTRLGFEPDEALMIGDDWNNDMVPAWQAGLNTFWINPQNPAPNHLQPDGIGSLEDLYTLITQDEWLMTLQPRPVQVAQIEPRFQGNISALLGMVSEIPDHYWHQRPDPNEWSPLEIIVHLRDSERTTQRSRLQTIAHEDNPFLTSPPTPPDPGTQHLIGLDGMAVALEFAAERAATIMWLGSLSEKDWMRPARHSIFGPTTLLEMAAFTARHDRLHINQLCQTVGKCE